MALSNQTGFAHLILIATLAVVLIGGTATVAAADNAKPGDTLYGLDRASEQVRETFAFGDTAKAEAKLDQATERLEELEALQNEGASSELLGEASDIYGQSISEAAAAVADAAQSGEGFDEAKANLVAEATQVHLDVLARVLGQVPEEAQEAIENAMEKSEAGAERSLEALNGQVSEEARQQAEDKIEESQQRRGAPEDIPNGNGATNETPGNAGQEQGNVPANATRP